jgi:hypothetical protein
LCLQGPQVQQMVAVCDQVRTHIISPQTAVAILAASYPIIPVQQIEHMIAGVASLPPAIAPPVPGNGIATPPSNGSAAPQIPPSGTVQ